MSGWCRAVLLDLDGTLADTAADLIAALNVMRARHKLAPLPVEQVIDCVSHGSRVMMKRHLTDDDDEIERLRPDFLVAYDETGHQRTVLFDGIAEFLDHLRGERIPWAIVTNKPEQQTETLMPVLPRFAEAASIVCGDTLARAKPHPDGLLHVCAKLGLQAHECLYVGDNGIDQQAAANCGMPFVGAGWGYCEIVTGMIAKSPGELAGLMRDSSWLAEKTV